jgi:hypothetical protein
VFRESVGRLVENTVDQQATESIPGMRAVDLVAQLWFDSPSEIANLLADSTCRATITGSDANYIDHTKTLIYVGEERPASAAWLRQGQLRR